MKNFLIQASIMIAGEDEKDAIIKFADMIKHNPDTKNIHWNTVPLANPVREEPDKDIKKGKEYPREETSNIYDINSFIEPKRYKEGVKL